MAQVASLNELKQEVEYLKVEASVKRIQISKSGDELLGFVKEHEKEDFFICKSDKVNLFRDRSGPCSVL